NFRLTCDMFSALFRSARIPKYRVCQRGGGGGMAQNREAARFGVGALCHGSNKIIGKYIFIKCLLNFMSELLELV
ncbi:MAG: hypothetical protein QSU88_12420, partial [Candidatus Methanoperedens sp.]|nr:hypothetical protein [Candidatus Methanoperedens sp.]